MWWCGCYVWDKWEQTVITVVQQSAARQCDSDATWWCSFVQVWFKKKLFYCDRFSIRADEKSQALLPVFEESRVCDLKSRYYWSNSWLQMVHMCWSVWMWHHAGNREKTRHRIQMTSPTVLDEECEDRSPPVRRSVLVSVCSCWTGCCVHWLTLGLIYRLFYRLFHFNIAVWLWVSTCYFQQPAFYWPGDVCVCVCLTYIVGTIVCWQSYSAQSLIMGPTLFFFKVRNVC